MSTSHTNLSLYPRNTILHTRFCGHNIHLELVWDAIFCGWLRVTYCSTAVQLHYLSVSFFLPKDSICNTLVTDLCIRTPCTSLSCLAPPQTSSATCWRSWTGTRSGRRRSPWKRGICPTRCISRVVHRLLDYLVHCFAGCDRPFICSSRPSFLVGAGSERVLGAPCRQLRIYYMYAYPGSVGGFGCGRDQVLFGLGCQVGAGCSYVSTACVGSRKQPENIQYLTN